MWLANKNGVTGIITHDGGVIGYSQSDFNADAAAVSELIPEALAKVSSPEAAAHVAVARALFNTDNFITRE